MMQKQDDFPYPVDWRKYPAEIAEPKEATNIFVKCKVNNKMTVKEISQAGVKAVEQELASHGILSVRASPVTRRQCREQLRSHVRFTVVCDFVAQKSFILSGLVHEAAESVYREIETNFPIAVAEVIMGITDETRSFLSAEALVATKRTDHINNEHAFLVPPGGRTEAMLLRRRLDLAEQDKALFAGMRARRPNRNRKKFEVPAAPDWLVRVEERKKREKEMEEQINLLVEPGRSRHVHRCGRCSRFDANFNRALVATSSCGPSTAIAQREEPTSSAAFNTMSRHAHHLRQQFGSAGSATTITTTTATATSVKEKEISSSAPASRNSEGHVDDQKQQQHLVMTGNQEKQVEKTDVSKTSRNSQDEKETRHLPSPTIQKQISFDDDANNSERMKKNSADRRSLPAELSVTPNSLSGDPALEAMRQALNLASRRQNLRPMNMLQLKFSSSSLNSVIDKSNVIR